MWSIHASLSVFEQSCPSSHNLPRNPVPRSEYETLFGLLNTTASSGRYHLVTGEHGTGKTTLALHAACAIGSGIFYYPIRGAGVADFASHLAVATKYVYSPDVVHPMHVVAQQWGLVSPARPAIDLQSLMEYLYDIAERFKAKYGRPPVLVFDNINILALEDPKTLKYLQSEAKFCADKGLIVFVFVSSEGSGPRDLQTRGDWSRISEVLEVGDIDDESAVHYLESYQIPHNISVALVNITGGRFALLGRAQSLWPARNLEAIREEIFGDVTQQFVTANLNLPTDPDEITPRHIKAWKQIIKIYDSPTKEIPYKAFSNAIGDSNLVDYLLRWNIFSYHHSRKSISFQSRPVELVVGEEIGKLDSQRRQNFMARITKNDPNFRIE